MKKQEYPLLEKGEIQVWWMSLVKSGLDEKSALKDLSGEEQQKAGQFVRDQDRHSFVLRRFMLRSLLNSLACEEGAKVKILRPEGGKPRVLGCRPGLEFSTSSSGEMAVVALSLQCSLGIDIEKINREFEYESVVERYFSDSEKQALELMIPVDRLAQFYRLWTRKEACLKKAGIGLAGLEDEEDPAGYGHISEIGPFQGYQVTLAYENPLNINIFEFQG